MFPPVSIGALTPTAKPGLVPTGDRTGPVVKCSVLDLENAPYPDNPVIPFSRIVHDRISIEAARGCPHACRFCQASVLYRPYRERTPSRVLDLALENLKNTGYGDLSLLSLSIGDYTGLLPLARMLMEKTQPCKVALSLPSIRVGSLDDSVVEEILRVRKTGFTLAPEAATVRLRSVINKNIDEEDLVRAAHFLATRGWRSLKLYFMIGLPTEREEDVEAIVRLAETIQKNARIARSGPFTVTVNVSTFVPKAHTPFQWERQLSREEAEEKQRFLRKKLRKPGFKIKWHDARQSLLEGLFARGDRTLCDLLETAYKLGCGLDGWNEHFRYDLWEEAFSAVSVNPEDFLQPHPGPETPLPWDWIDAGVHRDFLVREYRKAHREESTAFRCRGDCTRCNLCSSRSDTPAAPAETTPAAAKPETDARTPDSTTRVHVLPPRVAPARRIRLTYWKTGRCILLSHLETVNVLYRALRRSTLPICYTEGEHPQPRVSFSPALPVGVESHAEILDLWIHESLDRETVKARLNAVLPEGFSVVSAREVSLSAPSVEESITWVAYDILFTEDALWRPGTEELTLALEEFSTGLRQPAPAKGKKRKGWKEEARKVRRGKRR
jgi:radical SAM-linked protein